MHDDDEERFPRITLWQFLGGLLGIGIWFIYPFPDKAIVDALWNGRASKPEGNSHPSIPKGTGH